MHQNETKFFIWTKAQKQLMHAKKSIEFKLPTTQKTIFSDKPKKYDNMERIWNIYGEKLNI